MHPCWRVTSRALPVVYLVEPDAVERARVVAALAGVAREVVTFERGADFLVHRCTEPSACVVVAAGLADMSAVEFVAAAAAGAPVIVLGRVDDVSVAVEMIRAGATDVVDRPFDFGRLRAAVREATAPAAP
jgi:FixJ family two-component response regulator